MLIVNSKVYLLQHLFWKQILSEIIKGQRSKIKVPISLIMKIIQYLALFIFVTCCSHSAFAQLKFNGKVVEIVDGKTVVIELETKNRLTAELQYIEVPESQQQLHQIVKDHLQALLLGKFVEFRANALAPTKTVGQIFSDGVDISQQMIRDGAAWYSVAEKEQQDTTESQNYFITESQAKAEKLGIWSIENLVPAWKFRAEKEKINQPLTNPAEKKVAENQPKTKSIFGQPRFTAEASLNQPNAGMDAWGGDFGNYFSDENVNAAGLASRYISQFDIGYLATALKDFKLSEGGNSPKMIYRIYYYYKGSKFKSGEDAFIIGFLAESKNWQFMQANSLSIITDGQPNSLGEAYRLFRKTDTTTQELLLYKISRATLANLSSSKQVEFKVGKYSGQVEKTSQTLVSRLLDYSK